MNLLCLNCGESFTIDDAAVGPDGGAVKCAHCGLEHNIYRPFAGGSTDSSAGSAATERLLSVPEVAPPASSAGGRFASSFIKPLSAFSKHRKAGSADASDVVDSTGVPSGESVSGDDSPLPAALPELPDMPDLPDVSAASVSHSAISDTTIRMQASDLDEWADSIPDIVIDDIGGPFHVKSPAGLVLEFTDFQLIEEWARGIDKQDKYFVVDISGASTPMNDFIKTRKSGMRGNSTMSAIRASDEFQAGIGESGRKNRAADAGSDMSDLMTPGSSRRGGGSGKTMTTQQFKFKIESTEPETSKKWVVLAVVLSVAAVAAVLAVFVFDLL